MRQVVVTGSLSYDYIMDFPGRFAERIMPEKIHVISLSFLVDKLQKQFGGCATNLAYTLKLLGFEPKIITAAGSDFGPYKKFLQKQRLATSGIKVFKKDLTSSYFVVTDRDDNQIGSFYVGASRFNDQLSILENGKMFVTIGPTDPRAMKKYVRQCRKQKFDYLYDPAFQIANFTKTELKEGITGAAILIGNDYEIALIEKRLGISHIELTKLVPLTVTTFGRQGSLVETAGRRIRIRPAKPQNETDPTGAGDAYRAGFLAGYLRDFDLKTCGQMGSVAAVYTVEKYGTITHTFTKEEFSARYWKNFGTRLRL